MANCFSHASFLYAREAANRRIKEGRTIVKNTDKTIFDAFLALDTRPALFAPGDANIWTDDHLKKGMLAAHLEEENDAASYRPAKRSAVLRFLEERCPQATHPRVLDIGCGPGMYATALCESGRAVTGIDFSSNSIAYARRTAAENGHSIRYLEGDYLLTDFNEAEGRGYDAAIMISCDFGVLSADNRALLLRKVFAALRPGGAFLFDVMTTKRSPGSETRSWKCGKGGYWSDSAYLLLIPIQA